MTTATESDGPEMTETTPARDLSPFAETVARQIRIQMATAGITAADLAAAISANDDLKFSPSPDALSRRMSGRADWSLTELLAVAKFFRVPLSTITPDSLTEDVIR